MSEKSFELYGVTFYDAPEPVRDLVRYINWGRQTPIDERGAIRERRFKNDFLEAAVQTLREYLPQVSGVRRQALDEFIKSIERIRNRDAFELYGVTFLDAPHRVVCVIRSMGLGPLDELCGDHLDSAVQVLREYLPQVDGRRHRALAAYIKYVEKHITDVVDDQ